MPWYDEVGKKVLNKKRLDLVTNLSIDKGSPMIALLQGGRFINQDEKERIYARPTNASKMALLIDTLSRGLTKKKFAAFVMSIGQSDADKFMAHELISLYGGTGGEWSKEMNSVLEGDSSALICHLRKRVMNPIDELALNSACKDISNFKRYDITQNIGGDLDLIIARLYETEDMTDVMKDRICSESTMSAKAEMLLDSLIRGMTARRFFNFVDAIGDQAIAGQHLKQDIVDLYEKLGLKWGQTSVPTSFEESTCTGIQNSADTTRSTQDSPPGETIFADENVLDGGAPPEAVTCASPEKAATSVRKAGKSFRTQSVLKFRCQLANDLLVLSDEKDRRLLIQFGANGFHYGDSVPEPQECVDSINNVQDYSLVRSGNKIKILSESGSPPETAYVGGKAIQNDSSDSAVCQESSSGNVNIFPLKNVRTYYCSENECEEVTNDKNDTDKDTDACITCDALIELPHERRGSVYFLLLGFNTNLLKLIAFDIKHTTLKPVSEHSTSAAVKGVFCSLHQKKEIKTYFKYTAVWMADNTIDVGEVYTCQFISRQSLSMSAEVVGCIFMEVKNHKNGNREPHLAVCCVNENSLIIRFFHASDNWRELEQIKVKDLNAPVDMLYLKEKEVLIIATKAKYATVYYPTRVISDVKQVNHNQTESAVKSFKLVTDEENVEGAAVVHTFQHMVHLQSITVN